MQFLDYSALLGNVQIFRKLLGNSRLCAVVKNNAYGHGIEHVARYLDNVVDCFAVGNIEEASQINFVTNDILLLLPQTKTDTLAAVNAGYILTADSFETLDIISSVCFDLQRSARIHIKIDSGMSRLGFSQKQIDKLIVYLQTHSALTIEGAYSHFYGDKVAQCDKQLSRFLSCCNTIETALNKQFLKHISNSGGALLAEKYHLDMARIGLGLYGYGDSRLVPVKTVTARVIATKHINAGAIVGYGGDCIASRDMQVAVINAGYAHGFVRSLAGTKIKINGSKCKVLAVCMAMSIVDIGNIDVNIGDEVTLLGEGVNVSNCDVSIYELLCNLK